MGHGICAQNAMGIEFWFEYKVFHLVIIIAFTEMKPLEI